MKITKFVKILSKDYLHGKVASLFYESSKALQIVDCAYCKLCNKSFRIDRAGIRQVKSHQKSKNHKEKEYFKWQLQSKDLYYHLELLC